MDNRYKSALRRLVIATIVGSAMGVAIGYMTTLGYPSAIGMVLGCAYAIEIIDMSSAAFLSRKFENYSRGGKLALQMASSIVVHVVAWVLLVWIAGMILGFGLFRSDVVIWLAIFVVIVFIARSIRQLLDFYRELRQKDLVEERLKALASEAELKALKAQINPHFLFNSLNTIASLTNTDPHKAEEAIEKLADIFRYTLSSSNREFVTLQNELDFLDSYLDVEKARFGDRLEVVKSIQPETTSARIPSLILQPLVENCIKHGTTKDGKAKIEIRCYLEADAVNIEIRDQGQGIPEEIKKGIYTKGTGLRNVNERLLRIYGEAYGLKMRDNHPIGTVAVITIPGERK